jgi:hypothetical protein
MTATNEVWGAVKAALQGAAAAAYEIGAGLRLSVLVDEPEQRHEVDAELVHAMGRSWVLLRAHVTGRRTELDPWEALAHNATLAVGSLCVAQGDVLLRHVAPVDADAEYALQLKLVAHEAARLQRLLAARVTTTTDSLFANWS